MTPGTVSPTSSAAQMFGMKYQEWGETVKPSNKGNNFCEDEREGTELRLRGDGMAQWEERLGK